VISIESHPDCHDVVAIAAFEGWNDAAEAASDAVSHLLTTWAPGLSATVDPEDFYDFQVNRPHVGFDSAGDREISWRTTSFWVPDSRPGVRDTMLVTGIEPNLRWRSFTEEVLDYLEATGVTTLITLGALLADVPHTRPVPITGISSDEQLSAKHQLEPSRYTGPTGIVGVLQETAQRRGIATISLWAAVPHYVAQAPNPKATLALLGRLEDLLGTSIDLRGLPEEARAWERGVNEMASDDSDVADYVRSLEEERDTADLPEASGDAIAREFERYLRRRAEDG
jgi:proteasome assembly chaperone (PAC2) family protein